MSRILDILVPESSSAMSKEVVETALEAIRRRDLAEASMLLEEEVRADPFWLRGYLFLATIYEYEQKAEQGIATIEQGLAMCASSLRLFRAQGWGKTLERINGPVVHDRIRNTTERLRLYERMLRYRLTMLQIRCGCFDEAIAQWPDIDSEPCASRKGTTQLQHLANDFKKSKCLTCRIRHHYYMKSSGGPGRRVYSLRPAC
jgi:hypothetical protein